MIRHEIWGDEISRFQQVIILLYQSFRRVVRALWMDLFSLIVKYAANGIRNRIVEYWLISNTIGPPGLVVEFGDVCQ